MRIPVSERVPRSTEVPCDLEFDAGALTRFNTAEDGTARAALPDICASAAWAREILARRPYRDAEELLTASDAAVARLGQPRRRHGRPPDGPHLEIRSPPASSAAWRAPAPRCGPRCSSCLMKGSGIKGAATVER